MKGSKRISIDMEQDLLSGGGCMWRARMKYRQTDRQSQDEWLVEEERVEVEYERRGGGVLGGGRGSGGGGSRGTVVAPEALLGLLVYQQLVHRSLIHHHTQLVLIQPAVEEVL